MTLFNTSRLIDSFNLVGGIHTVQVKTKSVILSHSKNNSEMTTELYFNLKQLFSCFLAELQLSTSLSPLFLPLAAGFSFLILDSLPKRRQL